MTPLRTKPFNRDSQLTSYNDDSNSSRFQDDSVVNFDGYQDQAANELSIRKRKSSLKKAKKKHSFDDFLKNYPVKFSTPLDELWQQNDNDNNGYLDKEEAKEFLDEVVKVIQKNRKRNYDKTKFDQYFEQFDEDRNGFLSKGEMSQFIKIVFAE